MNTICNTIFFLPNKCWKKTITYHPASSSPALCYTLSCNCFEVEVAGDPDYTTFQNRTLELREWDVFLSLIAVPLIAPLTPFSKKVFGPQPDCGSCRFSLKETQSHPLSSKLLAYLNLHRAKITLTLTLVI